MDRSRDERLQAAEDEVRRLHEVLLQLEAERDAALARLNQIADEPFDTPEEEADLKRRVELADHEYGRTEEKITEVEDDFRRAQADFDFLVGADGEDLHEDSEEPRDSDEALDVHDAAAIWLSKRMDEDYMFGYTRDELLRAAKAQ
jgi:formate-dependent nitrite reductase cytochrome c552 subunit